jgi:hypothetical protein
MNRLTLTFLFVVLAMTVFGWPESSQILNFQGATHGWDNTNGVWRPIAVNGDGKMVTDAAVTIGSVTVDPAAPPTSNFMNIVNVTTASANVTSLINRKSFAIFNHSTTETLWASLDASYASATVNASIPIPPLGYISDELDSAKIIALVASTTFKATVYQAGY